MFEAHVLHLLRRYLGEYVHGLSGEALRISVWNGDVILKDLKLKAEALNSLKLPVIVKAGFVGSVSLKVPWKGLGKEPVIVQIDRIFLLAHPIHDGQTMKKEDIEKLFEAKLQQIEEAELATLEAISKSKQGTPATGSSWLGSLIATIIGNLKISISNVHIRYEDSVSNPGYPFSSGITLAKLAAVTMDEEGNETFDTSGALDKLRKSLHVERLALYHDSNSVPWKIDKRWEDLSPNEWIEIFEDGITECTAVSKWAKNRNYLLLPINGDLKYHRLGNEERNDPEVPFEKAALVLSDLSLRITEAQYHDWIKLLEVVSRYRIYVEVSHLRPLVPVKEAPYLWWRYAAEASLQQKKMCYRFSWDRIQYLCHLRRRYIQLYAGALQQLSNADNSETREIEKDLDSKVILLWRLLAHAKVESVKSKEAAEQRRLNKGGWFSFSWGGSESEDASVEDTPEGLQLSEERLTNEEWQAVHNLLSCQPDEESTSHSGKEAQNMIQLLVTVSIGKAAARIISINDIEIVCGRFEQLHLSTKFKNRNRSIQCDVLLKYYGLSVPEGSLAKSVCSEQKVNALTASFVYLPIGENVDWRLSATISPCHVTVLMESCDRVMEFVKRSNAVSPAVAFETATALQMKIEKVTRRAQEQFQMVLEEQSRFALDIDFDAPKVRVPIKKSGSSEQDSHFLLDFGHFTVHTNEHQPDEQRQNLYSRFYISGRDIAAFFTDHCPGCEKHTSVLPSYCDQQGEPMMDKCGNFYSLIDRCGMAVIVDQIKVPHPSYPSSRISVQVPNLSVHFSPARYGKLMELLNMLQGTIETCAQPTDENSQAEVALWSSTDLATSARILVWTGIGNSVATWQPCFLVLSGLYLYVLESEMSLYYQRYLSMASRRVHEVPFENVGGSQFCLAVSFRGMEAQKALESSSTWVVEFRDMDEKAIWLKQLVQATYKASAPPSDELDESHATEYKSADLVINGSLLETKLFIYGKTGLSDGDHLEENPIVEVFMGGGKVHVIRWEGDLTVKMKLHSLKIKDELQGLQSTHPQYLAFSVLKNENVGSSTGALDSHEHENGTPLPLTEDDDFIDALPEFLSSSDPGFSPHNMDTSHSGTMRDILDSVGVDSPQSSRDPGKGKGISGEIFYEAHGGEGNDFVCVTFATKTPGSPNYDGIDTQMSIRMSQLEFFFNRPTLVALMGFGSDLGGGNSTPSSAEVTETSDDISSMSKEKAEDSGRIKGLLGFGKGRVVFYLNMNVDSFTIFLNKEDGSQLAMLVQESFLLDFKVYPGSISIEGTLGNLRLCDMSLGSDHCWGWLCDIRNPGMESLIKIKFNSYSAEDDDYEGYDYSLSGRLSAVRIVFLYRFISEITAYFMEIATPVPEEAIQLVDKVGDFEWLIQKCEFDGATALKLDLSLDTPIIILPKNSTSKDSIQFDMGQLRVTNELIWHGSPDEDPSAVHIDILHLELIGMKMSVGIDGCLGRPVIRESRGFDVYVRRSLRDVFRKVPTFSLEVKIGLLHGVMTDKEYRVIMDCSLMNLSEEPNLPPSFRGIPSDSKDAMRLLADKVNMNSQILLARTVSILAVEINYALLELCSGTHELTPLAHIALEGLWVSYRMTALSEADLYVTIPKFSILDVRPDTKPEMRLMLGSSSDASKQSSTGKFSLFLNKGSFIRPNAEAGEGDIPYSTMILMDYRWRLSSQSFVIRVQQPRVLVVPDFLLAVGEFFVPALKTITGRDETMDPTNDPISANISIVLSEPVYKQKEDVVYLSPNKQLVADAPGINEYVYDGCGKLICLTEEAESKEYHSARSQPIIIIGRGKRLRFVNVKIENGSLLRKYTYLSNDSSYSVSEEDGVHILLLDNSSSGDDKKSLDYLQSSSDALNSASYPEGDSSTVQSFTFEAQLLSPEFTFYDGTKSSLDDSSYGEKLLRARMDLSFMYAAKEKDTWIRALLKDLTIEAGSGLIILDPVDISGGYTSVKDKTNISLLSTDICIHLSLSAISLVLNLQSQVAEALQFGNPIPLAPCTNYDRVWVSPEENGTLDNLTFWRPQAPPNYVILGDCVTSSSTPPSQAVLAVSNTYGRVRKPLGFNLIGLLSGIQGVESKEGHPDVEGDCSLWMPVAPPGYMALGCVANAGNQPPPNHIVYCIRSDLVTSATYTDCILSGPSNRGFPSGFSIWRLDNFLGSFYAHASAGCPPNYSVCDLSHLLLSNWNRQQSFSKDLSSNLVADDSSENEQRSNQSEIPSGWEVVRSASKASNYFISIPNFERIWWDKGSDLRRPVSIWRPVSRTGYGILGDCITDGLEPPALGIIFKTDNPEISAKPVQFTKVAHITGRGFDDIFFWYPIAPPGYVSLGCLVSKTDEAPLMNSFCCPRMDLVNQANIVDVPISRSSSSKSSQCWSIWRVENQACTFLARSDLKKPSSRLAYTIGDSVKPKTRENITAEMKLRFFSVTVLDSLCGMMTPLFDTTITNIKLATHGRAEAMNAVLICSIAASAFNTQLEAWEPLVEPFDGIFKFETYDTNVHPPATYGKRMRVAATSILNINVSAASLETFVQTIVSWRRQLELDQKATRLNEEANSLSRDGEDLPLSALDEDDFQTVTIENKLGCDIYLKRVEQDSDTVDLIHYNDCTSLWIPPPRFSDRLNVADESREARYYAGILILEAKDLRIIDDGNSHKLFCALRLVVDNQATDQLKLFPQSARTRCVTPLIYKCGDHDEGTARWNELFIFEVPRKGKAKLEVEVTNLAAKAGKGDVVGAFSFSIGQGANVLKKMSSARMLQQHCDSQNIVAYPLKRKGQHNDVERVDDYGHVMVSTSCFERKLTVNNQGDSNIDDGSDRDIGFWVGIGPEGVWESIRSVLPLSVVPKTLQDNFIAIEVVMKNGKKHAIIRSLVTVVNDCDVKMDVAVCPTASVNTHDSSMGTSRDILVEEVFENQRYASSARGNNKWSGLRNNDPGQWSTRDFSYSSKEFFEPPLPPGWQWTSTWTVDKSQFVDDDGWAYGSDFQGLRWPPTSSKSSTKSASDVVRRRRWTRPRQQLSEKGMDRSKSGSITIEPGCSAVLPWRSTFKNSDQSLQVCPIADDPNTPYCWGRGVAVGYYTFGKDQPFMDQAMITKQNTSKQGNKTPNFAFKLNQLEKKDILMSCSTNGNKQFWLSVGTDASVLHTELNTPVYDWKISINSPLKLENRLPCPAEFTVWEKPKEGSSIERQHGIISSRESAHIYSADLQKPVYLSLFVQGGWVLEKDPILVLDLSTVDRVSSFWMIHHQSKRRLRVSIERDFGGSSAAPKTIRFFVPYWIVNDCSLPLAYRLVEIEPTENANEDSPSPYLSASASLSIPVSRSMSRSASPALSRAVKSAKFSFKNPTISMDRRHGSRRGNQVFEHIVDTTPIPSMLSPQDYTSRSGVYATQKDTYLSPRLGIAVAIRSSETYGPGISLLELDKKQRVDAKAFSSDGSYYKLSALLNMTADRTKVIHFQPHTLFVNRAGCSFCLQQCDTHLMEWIHPTDAPKPFAWQSYAKTELLKLRVEGYKWSTPFSVSTEGVMRISLKKEFRADKMQFRVAVRSGTKNSQYEVIIRPNSASSPYRIENRSMFLPIQFRQVEGVSDSWKHLLPNAAASFYWEDLGRERLLELLVDGADPLKTEKYNIDEILDHQPIPIACGPIKALRVTILKEEKMNVVRISDLMPEIESSILSGHYSSPLSQDSSSASDCEFHVIVELAELGISIIDHTPEEILYLSVQNLLLAYSTGLGSGISRFKIRMRWIQVDNQLPLTPMPVLFRPQRVGGENDNILKFSITMQSDGSLDSCVYPYVGFHGPENSAFLINIQEPIIWRLHEMVQQVNLSRVSDTQTTAVSVDPIIEIGVLNISEVRIKVSMAMSPNQRPRGVLGFWLSLMTALGNTENMPVRINQKFHENVCMRQSSMITNAISNVQKDLLGQPLQLLSGVDILGNASSALGHMSKGVAALSMDKKFIQSRQRQENKGVEDFGDVIREGGGALAKGLFRGVTGILTKPLEGAKSSGVEGFVQGVGKGIIGAAAQPVSGVLDLLSKTTEGANAVRMKIAAAITSDEQLLRRRLPRVIGGDNLVRPYDEYRAQGQVILQLAESGSFFGQVDLFKVRGKFALSDAYEDHFLLPKAKILVVTHRRIILLQQPSNMIGQRKFSPARDPCSILWDVLLGDMATMEFTNGKKDIPNNPPSKLLLHMQSRSSESKEHTRLIKCNRETSQSLEVYTSIERAMRSYGPNLSMDMLKKKVRKPYSPIGDGSTGEAGSREGAGSWSPQQVPASLPPRSTFGSGTD